MWTDNELVEFHQILKDAGYHHGMVHPAAGVKPAVIRWQQTHRNKAGKCLAVDGIIGPETAWSLRNKEESEKSRGIGAGGDQKVAAIAAIRSKSRSPITATIASTASHA